MPVMLRVQYREAGSHPTKDDKMDKNKVEVVQDRIVDEAAEAIAEYRRLMALAAEEKHKLHILGFEVHDYTLCHRLMSGSHQNYIWQKATCHRAFRAKVEL